jgi:hypothetical protein
MTTIKRALVLLGVLAGLMVTTSLPASATFSVSRALPTTSINSIVIAAPTNVVGNLACASPSSTMSLTWTASTSPHISGYLVTVYFSDGFVQTVQLGATATSWSKTIAQYNVTAYSIQYSVTTQTTFGWIKESARTASFQC